MSRATPTSVFLSATLIAIGCDSKPASKDAEAAASAKQAEPKQAEPKPEPKPEPSIEPGSCAAFEQQGKLLPTGVESILRSEGWTQTAELTVRHNCLWYYPPGSVTEDVIKNSVGSFVNGLSFSAIDLGLAGALRQVDGLETEISGDIMPDDQRPVFSWMHKAHSHSDNPAYPVLRADMQRFIDAVPVETKYAELLAAKLTELDAVEIRARTFPDKIKYELMVTPLTAEGIPLVTKWLDAAGIVKREPGSSEPEPEHYYSAAGSTVFVTRVSALSK